MSYGVIVDVETTGLNCEEDKIIEIALLKFSLGTEPNIISLYSELEDPCEPISPEIQKLTHLTTELLQGTKIDWAKVKKDLDGASVVIAHNMEFDRSFLRKRSELEGLEVHWACSLNHIDWYKHGFKTRSLNYLASDHGFINPFAHRALFDCATTFRLITPYLKELLAKSHEVEYELLASNSPFKSKDSLKERGYRWNPEKRVWFKRIFEKELEEETVFLKEHVYNGKDLSEKIRVSE